MNNNYFAKKEELSKKAEEHTQWINDTYPTLTNKAVSNSKIYNEQYKFETNNIDMTKPIVMPLIILNSLDTVSSIYNEPDENNNITILNFASYKHPGGMFLQGSSAQEESLCHESNLYNILSQFENTYYADNSKNSNNHLYLNRSIFTPNVLFVKKNVLRFANVLTCAAPNYKAALKYCNIKKTENSIALAGRISFVLNCIKDSIINSESYKLGEKQTVILGAFGCGVFKQDAYEVADMFKNFIFTGNYNCFDKIVFSIPRGENYDKFVTVMHNLKRPVQKEPVIKDEEIIDID